MQSYNCFPPLEYIGLKSDYSDLTHFANLTLIVDRRLVLHDGYCSDPDEDIGQWEYDETETYKLSTYNFNVISKYINQLGDVDIEILNKLFIKDFMHCPCGSGYCCYEGSINVKSGRITSI